MCLVLINECVSGDLRSAKFENFPGDYALGPPPFGMPSANKLTLWKTTNLRALLHETMKIL